MSHKRFKYFCTCCRRYFFKKEMSIHHILPQSWYHGAGQTASCCIYCHRQFEKENKHLWVWTTKECEERWLKFVLKKRKEKS